MNDTKKTCYLFKDGNVLRLGGYFEYYETVYDVKIIDGKEYTNTQRVLKNCNIADIRCKNSTGFSVHEFQYELTGVYKFSVEYVLGLIYGNITSDFAPSQSTNDYVNAFMLGFERGMIPKSVVNVFSGKCDREGVCSWNKSIVEIIAFGYGFNNYVSIDMPIYHFLKLGKETIQKIDANRYISLAIKKIYDIDPLQDLSNKDVIKVFNTYINHKQQFKNRQYATS